MTNILDIKETGCKWVWDNSLCRTDSCFKTKGLFNKFFKKDVISYHIYCEPLNKWWECHSPASEKMIQSLIDEGRVGIAPTLSQIKKGCLR